MASNNETNQSEKSPPISSSVGLDSSDIRKTERQLMENVLCIVRDLKEKVELMQAQIGPQAKKWPLSE